MKGKIMMMIMILRMNIYQLLAHSMRKPIMMVRIVIFIMMMMAMIMMMMMMVDWWWYCKHSRADHEH